MIKIVRTDSSNPDFLLLVRSLDLELAERDGDQHPFFAQYNKVDSLQYVVIAYSGQTPVGCGAIKEFEAGIAEVKRMFVPKEFRGQRIAQSVLAELEHWAKELGYDRCILETGQKMIEAIALYNRSGYTPIASYGQYQNVESSVCMQKDL